VVKLNRVHDLDTKFGGLSRKAQVDLKCNCLNIKKKIILIFFKKTNHVFFIYIEIQIIFGSIKLSKSYHENSYKINLN
jgi:hypothetical protein